jgi:hypothetical protein
MRTDVHSGTAKLAQLLDGVDLGTLVIISWLSCATMTEMGVVRTNGGDNRSLEVRSAYM